MKKSTQKFRGITFSLWPVRIAIVWFLVSVIFVVVETVKTTELMLAVKGLLYRIFGVLMLLSLVLIPLGIYRWVQSSKNNVK